VRWSPQKRCPDGLNCNYATWCNVREIEWSRRCERGPATSQIPSYKLQSRSKHTVMISMMGCGAGQQCGLVHGLNRASETSMDTRLGAEHIHYSMKSVSKGATRITYPCSLSMLAVQPRLYLPNLVSPLIRILVAYRTILVGEG